MDEFNFKSPASAFVTTDVGGEKPDAGDIHIEILNLQAIWGTNGTAITVEPTIDPADDIVDLPPFFEDPSFG